MNSITGSYLADSLFGDYQGLRDQLMEILSDRDLAVRLDGDTPSLGSLCREIGEIEVQGRGDDHGAARLDPGTAAAGAITGR